MVISRHFGMEGGLFDYGIANIEGFFDNFDDACKYAEEQLKKATDFIEPMVWVLKCERTYQKAKEGLCYAYS